jgi:uncharacterized protein
MNEQAPSRTALVTGASAGIGTAFAHVFAEHGFEVVLTARRADRLEKLAAEISARYGRRAFVVPADLADPQAPARMVGELEERGLSIDALVNNAGYALAGYYASTTWGDQASALQVLVTAPAELTHRLLPGMIARRYGRIVNVASLAGLAPAWRGSTTYGASKAFLIKFSEALALEVAPHNVHVTALCPGYTRTEFHDVMGVRERIDRALPSSLWMDADTVARQGYAAVMAGHSLYVNGSINRGIALASKIVPRRLAAWMAGRVTRHSRPPQP